MWREKYAGLLLAVSLLEVGIATYLLKYTKRHHEDKGKGQDYSPFADETYDILVSAGARFVFNMACLAIAVKLGSVHVDARPEEIANELSRVTEEMKAPLLENLNKRQAKKVDAEFRRFNAKKVYSNLARGYYSSFTDTITQ